MTDQYRAITEPLVAHSNARYGPPLYSTHVVMRERYCANLISLALCACQAADHPSNGMIFSIGRQVSTVARMRSG
jgi:hypothetical protein